jgi:hypothetical protein
MGVYIGLNMRTPYVHYVNAGIACFDEVVELGEKVGVIVIVLYQFELIGIVLYETITWEVDRNSRNLCHCSMKCEEETD